MNVVIFGKGLGKARQVNLAGASVWFAAIAVAGLVSVTVLPYWRSSRWLRLPKILVKNLATEAPAILRARKARYCI